MTTTAKKAHKDFVDELKKQKKSSATVTAYQKDIEQLVDHLTKDGVTAVEQITLQHLNEFAKQISDLGMTPKTLSRKINSIKTFFRYLNSSNILKANPSSELKHPKLESKAPRILSKAEYNALKGVAKNDLRSSAMVELFLNTGIRISELANIKMEYLNLEKPATLFVPKQETLKERVVPLNKVAVDAIKAYLAATETKDRKYLFITKTGKPIMIRNLRSTIDTLFKKAGVPNAKVNDLRHTFVAHNITKGVDLKLISTIAGHKRLSTTEKYLAFVTIEAPVIISELVEL